ncbi:MAG: zf-TFIIB domain-containing protein [Magnetococcales bacterium]|nr:zf-TFIIB domain-containing protein [Magnetococcales bacterium]
MPLLLCPNCNVGMLVVQRSGIELDTCPQCRGIWLDRGELEKLLQPIRDQEHSPYAPNTGQHSQGHHPSRHYPSDKDKHYRKKSPMESLFEIFD